LVSRSPNIDSDRSAGRKALGGHEQHGASPAAQVQNSLVPSQRQILKQLCPNRELAPQRRVETTTDNSQNENDRQNQPSAASNDGIRDF
jgi:hypothetical protein